LVVYRDGFERKVVHQAKSLKGHAHETPIYRSEIGCAWPVTTRFFDGDKTGGNTSALGGVVLSHP
jgi:hypothetical protein